MEFKDFYNGSMYDFIVLEEFDKVGVKTAYRAHVLVELYNQKEGKVSRSALRRAIGNPNNSLFTSNILNPLVQEDYIEIYRGKSKKHKFKFVRLTQTGEMLVEKVMENLEAKLARSD